MNMKKQPLTPRQREVLDFVASCISDNRGVPPTGGEIANHFGFRKRVAYQHLSKLVSKGWLRKTHTGWRNLELV